MERDSFLPSPPCRRRLLLTPPTHTPIPLLSPEFADKIHEMINKLKDGAPSAPKNGKKSDNHWEALSTLITKYTTEAQENETKADKKRLIRSRKDRQKDNSTKEKSSQHNAMVAHFNLRRLSVEVDEDEIEQAMKAMQAESSKRLSKKVRQSEERRTAGAERQQATYRLPI